MSTPKPRKQLDSKRIQNSLRANILTKISNELEALCCRAVWRVCPEDIELAQHQIASKRLMLDDVLANIRGVQFFLSCVSCVTTNARTAGDSQREQLAYPSIAYFIVYQANESCNEELIFAALHNQDVEPQITPIRGRKRNRPEANIESAASELFQVVKDHNNATIQHMLDVSNVYCYTHARGGDTDDSDNSDEEAFDATHYPTVPCSLVIVNQGEYLSILNDAVQRLQQDGLVVEVDVSRDDISQCHYGTGSNEVSTLIKKIGMAMKICDHALYHSQVYAKPHGAKFTFVRMMDVSSYLHKLLANESLRDGVIKHFQMVEKILSHPACEIIQQLKFDLDLIEVSNGFCFSIANRQFRPHPVDNEPGVQISPRSYIAYDCSTPPHPGPFRDGILNSFQDPVVRVNFLNKFYQCLMASKMPQKVRKLVVAGPKDSGKTSWANVFHRVVPAESIATITSERQFSAAMLTDNTQLVIIDEWSVNTMQSDLAKTILQGGWMITAVKHGQPKRLMNNSPYYITTNNVPEFRDEDENVHRRIQVFNTTSLPVVETGVDRWIFDHAMDCIAWIAREIDEHREHVSSDEFWYEPGVRLTVDANECLTLFEPRDIRDIRPADLQEEPRRRDRSDTVIHERFREEYAVHNYERRRLERRGDTLEPEHGNDDILSNSPTRTPPTFDASSRNGGRVETTSSSASTSCEHHHPDEHQSPTGSLVPPSPNNRSGDSGDEQDHLAPPDSAADHTIADPSTTARQRGTSSPVNAAPDDRPSTSAEAYTEPDLSINMPQLRDDGQLPTPTQGWQLGTKDYNDKVAHLIKWQFYTDYRRCHVHGFLERLRKSELRRTVAERSFWVKADPTIDASLLMLGRTREVFDIKQFVARHPQTAKHLHSLREKANVRVMQDRCPFAKAMDEAAKETREESGSDDDDQHDGEPENLDRDGDPARPPLSSQSYWSKVKSWRPW